MSSRSAIPRFAARRRSRRSLANHRIGRADRVSHCRRMLAGGRLGGGDVIYTVYRFFSVQAWADRIGLALARLRPSCSGQWRRSRWWLTTPCSGGGAEAVRRIWTHEWSVRARVECALGLVSLRCGKGADLPVWLVCELIRFRLSADLVSPRSSPTATRVAPGRWSITRSLLSFRLSVAEGSVVEGESHDCTH